MLFLLPLENGELLLQLYFCIDHRSHPYLTDLTNHQNSTIMGLKYKHTNYMLIFSQHHNNETWTLLRELVVCSTLMHWIALDRTVFMLLCNYHSIMYKLKPQQHKLQTKTLTVNSQWTHYFGILRIPYNHFFSKYFVHRGQTIRNLNSLLLIQSNSYNYSYQTDHRASTPLWQT